MKKWYDAEAPHARPGHPIATDTSTRTLRALLAFATRSGGGWLLDVLTYSIMVYGAGVSAGWANVLGSVVGISFVFATSHGAVFGGRPGRRVRQFIWYSLYQVLLVAAMSLLVQAIVNADLLSPIASKFAVTPITLVLNFLVLRRIVAGTASGLSATKP